MVVPMEDLRFGAVAVFGRAALQHPRHHDVFLVALVPAAAAVLLLERPDVQECFSAGAFISGRLQGAQDLADGLHPSVRGGQMVDDGDRDGKVKE